MAGEAQRPLGWPPVAPPRPRLPILRYVALTLLGVVVAAGVAGLIIWLIIKPAPLEYTVEGAAVHGLNVSADGRVNATFDLRVVADNRNMKVSVYYDIMEVEVLYAESTVVASREVAPFHQPSRNATHIVARAVARGAALGETEARGMRREMARGRVTVEVRVRAWLRFKVAELKTKHYTLEAYCTQVVLKLPPREDFQRTYCDVDIDP